MRKYIEHECTAGKCGTHPTSSTTGTNIGLCRDRICKDCFMDTKVHGTELLRLWRLNHENT